MTRLILMVVIVFVVLFVLATLKGKQRGSASSIGFPYLPAKSLFSVAERSFLGVLDQAVGAEYRVFGKVRVADLVSVKPGLSNSARQGALNRVASKHFDFVVCRATDLSPVCAVELNDKSHSHQRAKARDDLIAKVCGAINLPLLTVQAQQAYSLQEVQARFIAAIAPPSLPVGT